MQTQKFTPGQRWISESESELGLGTVLKISDRQVTIVFMSCGETRIYSTETAPLSRVVFNSGDQIESHEGWKLTVTETEEQDNLIFYHGQTQDGQLEILPETSLSNFIQLNSPLDRLITTQLDDNKWFELRSETFQALQQISQSPVAGLGGARVELIPHQMFIANEVGRRQAPRVLLADEVGLGKTIEAGLILHYQLLHEQIQRVLVVVPDPLVHQWLVEMLRRFNLSFQIMDEEKYAAIREEDPDANPFSSSQLMLCQLSFLRQSEQIQQQAIAAGWDTLVVDEAHHLEWSEDQASEEYSLVEAIASEVPSLLLLTATPEQLGVQGHFARLRLLDPARFNSLQEFIEDGSHYREVAELATPLHEGTALNKTQIRRLRDSVGLNFISEEQWKKLEHSHIFDEEGLRAKLLTRLIDQHGTGRILFRNTRNAIAGFPERHLRTYELPLDTKPIKAISTWLKGFLSQIYPDKCLLICSSSDTVLSFFEELRIQHGIHAAVFHENMSIVERDRAAAWFANPEEDCQLLISSEIGSEGRNFQFLHHLVLHELPENADLLEQRIGRLDRIGQSSTIQIHTPYQLASRDHKLVHWYHNALSAFENTCAIGSQVTSQLQDQFRTALEKYDPNDKAFISLIEDAAKLAKQKVADLDEGRDKLLELNSNQPEIVESLLKKLHDLNFDPGLQNYLLDLFECFGVDSEEQSNKCWIVKPGRHMQVSHFPGIPDEGLTLTFDRQVATAREDVEFMSWDHPMVISAMDMVTSNPYGQASLAIIEAESLPHGGLFVECLYRVHCTVNRELKIERFLPPQTLRFVVSETGINIAPRFPMETLSSIMHPADKVQMRTFIKSRAKDIQTLVKSTQALAKDSLPSIAMSAEQKISEEIGDEINRLTELQKHNKLIRNSEIQSLTQYKHNLQHAVQGLVEQLIAVRVLVNIH